MVVKIENEWFLAIFCIKKERNLSVPLFLRLSPDTPSSSSHTSAIFMALTPTLFEATLVPILVF
jgi:hypothetical protein